MTKDISGSLKYAQTNIFSIHHHFFQTKPVSNRLEILKNRKIFKIQKKNVKYLKYKKKRKKAEMQKWCIELYF